MFYMLQGGKHVHWGRGSDDAAWVDAVACVGYVWQEEFLSDWRTEPRFVDI